MLSIADIAFGIHNAVQGHASQLEEIHFLPVDQGNPVLGIGYADEWDPFIAPVLLERRGWVRTDRQNFHTPAFELIISIAQARQLRAAIRSHKAAQKCQQDRSPAKLRQPDPMSINVFRLKIGRRVPRCDQLAHSWVLFSNHLFH